MSIQELLETGYDHTYGNADSRAVVAAVINGEHSVEDIIRAFYNLDRQWQLPLVNVMRTLAITGYCSLEHGRAMLHMTSAVAQTPRSEEYFKTLEALASVPSLVLAVVEYVDTLLTVADEPSRQLARYAAALVADKYAEADASALRADMEAALREWESFEAAQERWRERQRAAMTSTHITLDGIGALRANAAQQYFTKSADDDNASRPSASP